METNKRSARAVGILILTATITYIIGTGLIASVLKTPDYLLAAYPNRIQIVLGVLLQFVDAAAVVGVGVLLFPVLRKQGEATALGYAATRILECAFLVVGGIATLSVIALSQDMMHAGAQYAIYSSTVGTLLATGSHTAYLIAMSTLGLGSLPFCLLLYRSGLIPRSLSVLGLVGYAALFVGSLLELFGLDLAMLHYIPGGLFELILPIWLILKGFNSSVTVSESTQSHLNEIDNRNLSAA